MKTRLAFVWMTTLVAFSFAWANLDDTQEQIEQRYGKPIEVEPPAKPATYTAVYAKEGIHIRVSFISGRAQFKRYWRPGGKISPAEKKAILDSNQLSNMPWKHVEKKDNFAPRLQGTGEHWIIGGALAEAYVDEARVGKKGNKNTVVESVEFATKQWLDLGAGRF